MRINTIKSLNDIALIKQYFKSKNDFVYDRHLLYFTLGINTCLKPDKLLKIKVSDLVSSNQMVREYIISNNYKFYFNHNCKEAISNFMIKYNSEYNSDYYLFGGEKPFSYNFINKMYKSVMEELDLDFLFNRMSLHKTFVYWQIYYNHSDYVKMTKLIRLLKVDALIRDLNLYSEYPLDDDMIYINNVNL